MDDGSLLIVSMYRKALMRYDSQGLRLHADLSELTGSFNNDMVVDAQGRAYIGNFGFDFHKGETPQPTVLTLVTPEGAARDYRS